MTENLSLLSISPIETIEPPEATTSRPSDVLMLATVIPLAVKVAYEALLARTLKVPSTTSPLSMVASATTA